MFEQLNYKAFRQRYEEQHPASVPIKTPELSPYPEWLKWATLLMFVCSALLSGVHTVPVVRAGIPTTIPQVVGDAVSLTAFVSVELAILLSAYAMVGGGGLAVGGVLFLATLTALVANIYSVIKAYQIATGGGDPGTLAVAIIIGVVAPGIAFLSGKLFVNMHRASRMVQQRGESKYREESQTWDARIEAAWTAYMDSVQASVQNGVQNGQASRTGVNQSSIVEKYFMDNPSNLDGMPIRDVAAMLNVSKSTVANVRAKMLSNGHRVEG